MRKHTKILSVVALIFLICSIFAGIALAVNVSDDSSSNKYNIVFVSDESGSMRYTDPSLYRYDAIDLFLGLMSNEGNYVGLVSFDSTAYDSQAVAAVGSKEEKDALSATIRGNQGTNGDTDIGGALVKAVELLDANANPDLPSIILLLTDGNTDLDNNPGVVSEEELESEQAKADAVEACREAGYTIYSICLNIDGSADIAETEQIATATGGRAMEVNDASDLDEVFEAFYQLIYGTSPIDVIDGTFEVPSAGVEEANILIHGDVTEVTFTAPDGSDYPDAEMTRIGDITLEKIIKPAAGTWKVAVSSETGAKFYIRLLFNYDYSVNDVSKFENAYQPGDDVDIRAELADASGNPFILTDDGYYSAEVRFVNQNDEVIDKLPMKIVNGGFEAAYNVAENDHAYRYYIAVTKQDKDSEEDIMKRSETKQFVSGGNTAPVSNGDIKEVVKLWPFRSNTYKLDLTTLATDAEDSTLEYTVLSSSYIDKADKADGDYSIEGTTLVQDKFSLRKGSYVIRCVDSGGMYCDVKVAVSTINVGLLTLLGMLLIGLIIAGVLLGGLYIALNKPFNGDVYLRVGYDGEENKRSKRRGRIKLNTFNVPLQGIDGKKSYFQALGGSGVELNTDKEVYYAGRKTRKVTISAGGTGTEIRLDENGTNVIYVKFVSRVTGTTRRGGSGRKPPSPVKKTIRTPGRSSKSPLSRGTRGSNK